MRKADASVWNKTWGSSKTAAKYSAMDNIIFKEIQKITDFKGKETIELGCGRGVLSKMMLENGANKVTLVDFSEEALKIAQPFLGDKGTVFIKGDILELPENVKYDIAFSSGVAEHFSCDLRRNIIRKHLSLALDKVVIIVPARPHFNTIRHKKQRTVNLYGWQYAFSKNEMKEMIDEDPDFRIIENRRFYCLYGVNMFELFGIENRNIFARSWNLCLQVFDRIIMITRIRKLLDILLEPLDGHYGGLLIVVAKKVRSEK